MDEIVTIGSMALWIAAIIIGGIIGWYLADRKYNKKNYEKL